MFWKYPHWSAFCDTRIKLFNFPSGWEDGGIRQVKAFLFDAEDTIYSSYLETEKCLKFQTRASERVWEFILLSSSILVVKVI